MRMLQTPFKHSTLYLLENLPLGMLQQTCERLKPIKYQLQPALLWSHMEEHVSEEQQHCQTVKVISL